jgi:hypothetical protein
LQSGELVVAPLRAEMKMIRDENNQLLDLPMYWEVEAQTVEK